jgi:hypothetical protein
MAAPVADLLARQSALQAEAASVLADLELSDVGPVLLTGSYVSGLMCWPGLDIMVHVGPGFAPRDVLRLLERFVDRPDVAAFDYRDERYHVPIALSRNGRSWDTNLTTWHENLRDTVTADQRAAILRIKDFWRRLPSYPDEIGGTDIYAAVLDDGVGTPEEFATWLTDHGHPGA